MPVGLYILIELLHGEALGISGLPPCQRRYQTATYKRQQGRYFTMWRQYQDNDISLMPVKEMFLFKPGIDTNTGLLAGGQ